jgi:RHS repeat-associated protein
VLDEYEGTLLREFVYGVGLDEPVRMWTSGAYYYFAQNAIGSVVAVMNASGAVVERYKYLACGDEQILGPTGAPLAASTCGNPYRFQGRWRDFDEGSPLTYFRARYYDPETGRFTSRDPMGVWFDGMQRGNAYGAFRNNGLNFCDPTGLGWLGTIANYVVAGALTLGGADAATANTAGNVAQALVDGGSTVAPAAAAAAATTTTTAAGTAGGTAGTAGGTVAAPATGTATGTGTGTVVAGVLSTVSLPGSLLASGVYDIAEGRIEAQAGYAQAQANSLSVQASNYANLMQSGLNFSGGIAGGAGEGAGSRASPPTPT